MDFEAMKSAAWFGVAAVCNALTWFGYFLAQAATPAPPGLLELIQLGGTGGLIVALIVAVVTLWRDRAAQDKARQDEVAALRDVITAERKEHRVEVAQMREKLTDELRRQLEQLRKEGAQAIQAERRRSDHAYQTKPPGQ